MFETSKSLIRRSYDKRYATRWLVGDGIDIGSGNDPLSRYTSLFPLMKDVRSWDMIDGDAMEMDGVADDAYDFVHSSHCLEHLEDPAVAINHWVRICRPGGHLIILVPDEDLYEQGVWPSTFNRDHKWSFTIGKEKSWCPRSVNVIELLQEVWDAVAIQKIELLDNGFDYAAPRVDQTTSLLGESAIEIVMRRL